MVDLSKPLPGSGRAERRKRKAVKARPRKRAERAQAKLDAESDRAIRYDCYRRDHCHCRAFGAGLSFAASPENGWFQQSENHHIVSRAQGGSDYAWNRITLSPYAHRLHHDGLLDIDGNADGLVAFTLYRWVNGQRVFVRQWKG